MGGIPAASLTVLVQAKGMQQMTKDLRSVDGQLRKAGIQAGGAAKDLEGTGKRGSKALGALKTAAKAVGGVAIGAGLLKGAKDSISAFEESRKIGKQTEAVLKSTGNAANVTAKQVGDLAGAISRKTGVDDELIQQGANVLLTFKNIRNEAGAGKDIFNQTTQAAVDLSAAGFGSIDSASKQLGKALNDPVKGMTALGRSGVTFSEDQKQAIGALMETGKAADRVKAQQLILKEVQSQVGGSAAAQGSAMDKLKVAFGNIQESIGGALVPIIDKGARALTALFEGMQNGTGAGGVLVDVFNAVKGVISTTASAVQALLTPFVAVGKAIVSNKDAMIALSPIAVMITAHFVRLAAVAAFGAVLRGLAGAFWALNAAMRANPIMLVVTALSLIAAGLVLAWKKSETFRNIVGGAFKGVKVAFGWVLNAAKNVFGWLKSNWPTILAILTGPIGLAVLAIVKNWDKIKGATKAVWNFIKRVVGGAASWVWDKVIWLKNRLENGFRRIWDVAKNFGDGLKDRVIGGFKTGINFIIDQVNRLIRVFNKLPGPNIGLVGALAQGGQIAQYAQGGITAGGVVRAPLLMMGEDAPRHPEWVIPTNPAYRARALGLLGAAARDIGVQGFARGGRTAPGGGRATHIDQSREVHLHEHGDRNYYFEADEDRATRKQLWQLRVAGLA